MTDWSPREKQLQPLVRAAMNRDVFRLPSTHWFSEVPVTAPAEGFRDGAASIRVDLLAWVHEGFRGPGKGLHAVEVKRAADRDRARLERQVGTCLRAADYAWLVVTDGEPEYPDDRVGLARYDHRDDRLRVRREPVRAGGDTHLFYRRVATMLDRFAARLDAQAPDSLEGYRLRDARLDRLDHALRHFADGAPEFACPACRRETELLDQRLPGCDAEPPALARCDGCGITWAAEQAREAAHDLGGPDPAGEA